MLIAVFGGTGTAGRAVVARGLERGHEVRSVSRHASGEAGSRAADLLTGAGLEEALDGVDVVLDCTNPAQLARSAVQAHLIDGTRRLVTAEKAAGVRRHVVLSIVGIDDVPLGYYRAKLGQEQAARAGEVPVSVVRATQFHDFPRQILARLARGPVAFVPRMRMQPVATTAVADVLLDAAERASPAPLLQIAGPREEQLVTLARKTIRARRQRLIVVPVALPGSAGRAVRAGGLLLPEGPTAGPDFDTWLARAT